MLRVYRTLASTQVTENKQILSVAGTENPIFSLPTLLRSSVCLGPGEGLLLLKTLHLFPSASKTLCLSQKIPGNCEKAPLYWVECR